MPQDMFPIQDDEDFFAIQIAVDVANQLLHDPRITPQQIIGIGYALYALQRFPITTPDVDVTFGVHIDGKDRLEYLNYHITENRFEISKGGYTQGDSYSNGNFYIDSSGYTKHEAEPYFITQTQDIVAGWLNNDNTKISVINESYIEEFDEDEIEQNPFNYHPLNQKAKQLLQSPKNYRSLTDEIYILQLIHFGLQSLDEQMRQKRQQIRKQHFMQHLEDKLKNLRWDMEPWEVMSWLLQNRELSDLLETDNIIDGANTAMWIVINQILIDLSEHIQETYLTPHTQLHLFDTNR